MTRLHQIGRVDAPVLCKRRNERTTYGTLHVRSIRVPVCLSLTCLSCAAMTLPDEP